MNLQVPSMHPKTPDFERRTLTWRLGFTVTRASYVGIKIPEASPHPAGEMWRRGEITFSQLTPSEMDMNKPGRRGFRFLSETLGFQRSPAEHVRNGLSWRLTMFRLFRAYRSRDLWLGKQQAQCFYTV